MLYYVLICGTSSLTSKLPKKQVQVAVILKKPNFLGHFFVFWAILVHHLHNLAFLNNFDPVLNWKLYKVWYLCPFFSLSINRKIKRAVVVPLLLICHLKQLCLEEAIWLIARVRSFSLVAHLHLDVRWPDNSLIVSSGMLGCDDVWQVRIWWCALSNWKYSWPHHLQPIINTTTIFLPIQN